MRWPTEAWHRRSTRVDPCLAMTGVVAPGRRHAKFTLGVHDAPRPRGSIPKLAGLANFESICGHLARASAAMSALTSPVPAVKVLHNAALIMVNADFAGGSP